MARCNIHTPDVYGPGNEEPQLLGWFDFAKNQGYWSDRDAVTRNGSGGPGRGEAIVLTAGGKWVLERWTDWQGQQDRYEYVTAEQARDWLLTNGFDEAAASIDPVADEEDRRPGRPDIGGRVTVSLGADLLPKIDAYASERGISRAAALRQFAKTCLGRQVHVFRRGDEVTSTWFDGVGEVVRTRLERGVTTVVVLLPDPSEGNERGEADFAPQSLTPATTGETT